MDKNLSISDDKLSKIVSSLKERAIFVKDLVDLSEYFFTAPSTYDEKAANKNWKEGIVLEDEQSGAMVYLRYGKGK